MAYGKKLQVLIQKPVHLRLQSEEAGNEANQVTT